ncbi:hypothetical protein [Streptomyces alboflavus]|uniref:hypothetical protein n=1 Tax=Streptomyces alboflavus TaxID=67267 RepID=UPI003681662D
MRSKRFLAGVATLASVGLVGGIASQAMADSNTPAAITAEDGRALFAGAFFLQGETGKDLAGSPYFNGSATVLKANNTAKAKAAVSKVLDRIETDRPGFFKGFGQQLSSGDPRLVKAGLTEGGKALGAVAKTETFKKELGNAKGLVVVAVNVVAAVNVVTSAAAVNVAAVYNRVKLWAPPQNSGSGIAQEKAIADLTQRLAA